MLENKFLYWMDKFYGFFIKIGSNLQSVFLLYMRLTWGHQLIKTGLDKLENITETATLFTKLDIPSPLYHAYGVGFLEVIAGICLMIGFASRIIMMPLIILMITALSLAHAEALKDFKFALEPQILVIQEPYPFLITALMVFVFGPGRVSIDAFIKRWMDRQPRY